MNDIVRDFLVETTENLAQMDLDLVTMEKGPPDGETLARIFRTIHAVKGVVYSGQGRRVGLVIGRILDIVEEAVVTRSAASRHGILYAAVVQGRVTEFLNVEELIQANERNAVPAGQPVAVDVEEKMFERPPDTLRGSARDLIRGAYKLDDRLLLVLDTERTANLAAAGLARL